jgi:hydroxymethylbilane synthase
MVSFPIRPATGTPAPHGLRDMEPGSMVRRHAPTLPLRVGTRGSPLALFQTRLFLSMITRFCPLMRQMNAFEEHQITTSGDKVQDRALAEVGGKGLFAKEIHEAMLDGRIDFAVHSLKDLETRLPPGIVLACTLRREDPRDAMVFGPTCGEGNDADPFAALPRGALVGTASVRRQAQLLHRRPDLRCEMIRGNVGTRLGRVRRGDFDASLLAIAGLKRLELAHEVGAAIAPEIMLPAVCQGIIGVTVREDDAELCELLSALEDAESRAVSLAERALQHALDGSCRTPMGGYATRQADGSLRLIGLVARADGSWLLQREVSGSPRDAEAMGRELGLSLKRDAPDDIFAD